MKNKKIEREGKNKAIYGMTANDYDIFRASTTNDVF